MRIEYRPSPIHGLGGFAVEAIAVGTAVIEYIGRRIDGIECVRQCSQNNHFIFALADGVYLDGNVEWNPARFLNHSCDPNCTAELLGGRLWIVARRAMAAGEEVTFNYGYDLESFRDYPCHCGSPKCVGYILAEEFMTDRSQ
jgi:hypothetical protein